MTPSAQTDTVEAGARPILVADDDPEMVSILVEALSHKGYRVATARNGKEALARVEDERPQLILLDMKMPIMDGWTFARELHERYGRSIPIVVITAVEDSTLRADELGAEGELGKPFSLQHLYDVVEDILPRGGGAS
ncbi:MAG: response regulator [Labilithrix sp.]|nr:response regulator [Labilithrix sp.]